MTAAANRARHPPNPTAAVRLRVAPEPESPSPSCDRRALPVAQAILAASGADLVILFGSRARGDYEENRSDIDLLLVQPELPAPPQRQSILNVARHAAQKAYRKPVTVQLVWQTAGEFERSRQSLNHLNARAVREGIVMPRHPENYPGAPDNYAYETEVAAQRAANADTHHRVFENYHYLFEHGMADISDLDRVAGKNAQEALEHALKGLIAANGAAYPRTHDLVELLAAARAADPEFSAGFRPSIDYLVLNRYSGSADYDIPQTPLTELEHYRECITADYAAVRKRIAELLAELRNPQ